MKDTRAIVSMDVGFLIVIMVLSYCSPCILSMSCGFTISSTVARVPGEWHHVGRASD